MNCIALHETDQQMLGLVAKMKEACFDVFLACEGGDGHEFSLPTVKIKPQVDIDQATNQLSAWLLDQGLFHFTVQAEKLYQKSIHPMPESFLQVQFWSNEDIMRFSDKEFHAPCHISRKVEDDQCHHQDELSNHS